MLHIGDTAPDFTLPSQEDKMYNLSDFRGKWVVLYFYPKDLTPGCTTEACNFQESLPQFESLNAVVLGVSKDPVKQHEKFAKKHSLRFPLLSDEKSDTCENYGVWQKKSMYGKEFMGIQRSTFIIDPNGKIAKVYPKVNVKEHHGEVYSDLQELQ